MKGTDFVLVRGQKEMSAMFSFTPLIDNASHKPIYYQLHEYIKEEIIKGNIKGGEKLPSLRKLSNDLKLSRNTIETAYEQLYAEGYIKRIVRVGYLVEDIDFALLNEYCDSDSMNLIDNYSNDLKTIQYDFAPQYMDKECYNFRIWKSIINSVINENFEKLLSYGESQGEYELRFEIAKYVYENRGVSCNPNQIVVGAGTQYCLNLICQILRESHESIGMEDPGSNYIRFVFERNQFDIKPIKVNNDGLDVEELEKSKIKLVFVTPSHQFPKGVIMSAKNRLQLLNWAKNNDGIIIEDDYDSEMRFTGKPIPSLKSFDKFDKVIYLGTFSKIFMPTLRISFMILPNWLINTYLDKYKMISQTTSKLNQLALAQFIKKGYLQSHIRKMRKHYENKYNAITKAIYEYMKHNVKIISSSSGMRVILEIKTNLTEDEIVGLAKNSYIKIEPISKYYIDKNNYKSNEKVKVLISYKGISIKDIEPSIKALSYAWFNCNDC